MHRTPHSPEPDHDKQPQVYLASATKTAGVFAVGVATSEAINRIDPSIFKQSDPEIAGQENEVSANSDETDSATTELTTMTSVDQATGIQDEMSFSEAFQAARAEVGSPGLFKYQGAYYSTFLESEFEALSPEERLAYSQQVQEIIATENDLSTTEDRTETEELNEQDAVSEANTTPGEPVAQLTDTPTANEPTAQVAPASNNEFTEEQAEMTTATEPVFADSELVDVNLDGTPEALLINKDNDNLAEMILSSNGQQTYAFVDSENDGMIDSQYLLTAEGKLEFIAELDNPFPAPKMATVQYRDLQGGDGIIDAKLYDKDADGIADRVDVDVEGDGLFGKAYFDTNGDGKLDTVADVDEDGVLSNITVLNTPFDAPELLGEIKSTPVETTEDENGLLAESNTPGVDFTGETDSDDDEMAGIENNSDMDDWD